jgi:hypothetical protein
MSQNQEIIEAKLCAFIDGELDAEGQVEIEKHLEANPQHRRLLESLKATRDLIKWLPREAAPSEVAETLNGQLERSVLLDSESDFLRPSIWPRVMAAAAIVLLTAGLGLAVYFTLPKSQKSATPFAVKNPDASGPEMPAEADRGDEAAGRRERSGVMSRDGATEPRSATLSKGGQPESAKSESAKSDAEELERWAKQVGNNRDAINAVANGSQNQVSQTAPLASSNAVVMLVRSSAPQATRLRVTNYLDSQKIQWKETASPTQAQLTRQMPSWNFGDAREARRQVESTSQNAVTTQQAEAVAAPVPAVSKAAGEALSQNSAATQPAPNAPTGNSTDHLAVAQGMYVARMSRQQAVSLGNTISQESAQSTELKDLSGATLTLAELGAGRPNAYGILNAATTEPAALGQGFNYQNRAARRVGGQMAGGFGGGGGGGGGFGGAAAPATQNTDQQQQSSAANQAVVPATSQASTRESQSAGPATVPSDESLDVVIVVEGGATESPASQPATQPSAQPTSQPAGQ